MRIPSFVLAAVVISLMLAPVQAQAAGRNYSDTFTSLSTTNWDVYDSVGHDGHGLRRPSQVRVVNGVLVITGTANGTTGGMKWRNRSQTFGQWDIRMRARKGCICYHPVVLLWGADGGSGVDNPYGEIDIVEVWQRPNRDQNSFSVHYGDGSQFVEGNVAVDMTQWHIYHVVWQAGYIYTWIDDNPTYFSVDDAGVIPTGPMDLTIQLDWFPDEGTAGGPTATMEVDYVKQFAQPVEY